MTLKVVNLKAENFKRLKAVDITPEGDVVFIGGRNAQGKTSVLDAIWAALAGGEASRAIKKPIRDGESQASVEVDLGDYKVTRRWTKDDGGTLTVTAPNGAKFPSPQKMLDELIGARAFDPLAFTRLSAKDQVAALLSVVDLDVDLDALAAERAGLYDARTEIGRQGKALGDEVAVDDSLPTEEVSAAELIGRIRKAQELVASAAGLAQGVAAAEAEVERLRGALAAAEQTLAERKAEAALHEEAAAGAEDVAALEAQLSEVDATNARIRSNNEARVVNEKRQALRAEYQALSAKIDKLDADKAAALAKAEFPVPGLGFDESGVTLNGVPFGQASAAEQLKVSTALAMAANPTLRVLRILDGSLLDKDSLRLIAEMAAEHDYQVWVEVVDESGELGVVIEDGEVVGV